LAVQVEGYGEGEGKALLKEVVKDQKVGLLMAFAKGEANEMAEGANMEWVRFAKMEDSLEVVGTLWGFQVENSAEGWVEVED
jgi:hypothetical protein